MNLPQKLLDPLPSDLMKRVKRLAYDLAFGVVNGLWQPVVEIGGGSFADFYFMAAQEIRPYLDEVWGDPDPPYPALLITFGYVRPASGAIYYLTEKAFTLLEEPPPIAIFISYRRSVSSAFAMLIAAELRLVGFQPFIDIQDIPLGDKWHALVEKRVKESNIFIVVIGPESLDSTYVQKEIEWALENEQNRRIIPILHGKFTAEELKIAYPTLQQNNLISIQNDHATDFYAALQLLKNALGV